MATTTNPWAQPIDPDILGKLKAAGPYGTVVGPDGTTYASSGQEQNNEGGWGYTPLGYTSYAPGQTYNAPGAARNEYGLDGGFAQAGHNESPSWRDAIAPALAATAMMGLPGGALSGLFGGGAAGGSGAFLGEGVASGIPAWDAAAGSGLAGASGVAGGSGAFLGEGAASGVPAWDAAGGSGVAGAGGSGAFLGEGVTSGVPAWDAAAGSGVAGGTAAGGAGAATGAAAGTAGTAAGTAAAEGAAAASAGTGAASGLGGVAASALSGLSGADYKMLASGLLGLGGTIASSNNGSAPTAPDPTATANAQFQLNKDSANYSAGLNRVNQTGPYGSLNYTRVAGQNGQPDTWTANYGLDPGQQKLLDGSNRMASTLSDTGNDLALHGQNMLSAPVDLNPGGMQKTLDTQNLPSVIASNKLADDLQTQRDTLYREQTAYLDPQFANTEHDTENQLQQQGINQTTNPAAYARSMDQLNRDKTFAYQSAMNNAITGGGAEQSRLLNMSLATNQNAFSQAVQSGNFQNQAQQQTANEILAQRGQTVSELGGLQKAAQPTMPTFGNVPTANVGTPDLATLIQQGYANQMGGYNAKVSQNNAITSGLFGLGSSLLSSGVK